jgi:hypothetical protein
VFLVFSSPSFSLPLPNCSSPGAGSRSGSWLSYGERLVLWGLKALWTLAIPYPAPACPGPYGERDDQQVFIQKVVPNASQLFVRLSSTGQR